MIGRPVDELLEALEQALAETPERKDAAREARCSSLAPGLPLVHRTAGPKYPTAWRTILAERRIVAFEASTDRERDLGLAHVVYFFLGCAAYPEGIAALLFAASDDLRRRSTFTPFDTGALDGYLRPADPGRRDAWDEAAKKAVLAGHLGRGEEAARFFGPFAAGHLTDPLDYVRRPQVSATDWPAYHGLESTSGDRRAWTIESRCMVTSRSPPAPVGSGRSCSATATSWATCRTGSPAW
jgi:hypothetical protein